MRESFTDTTRARTSVSSADQKTLEQLSSFLRGEISAVETYRQAIAKFPGHPELATLQRNMESHQTRVQLLSAEIRRLGGTPPTDSGPWGSFAKAVEGAGAALGFDVAIAALEQGEDHGRNDYRRDRDELAGPARSLVENQLLPEQLKTHDAMSALKKRS